MPFDSSGTYTPASGAETAAAGQVLQSAVWNAIFTDLANNGLSKVLTRAGNDSAETTIASAATVDLSTAGSFRVLISGSVTITSFGTGANLMKIIRFSGSPTLTYNATSMILPGAANIKAFAGDEALVTSDASGNWRVVAWQSNDGQEVVHAPDFRNILWMNGSLDIWQRGAGSSSSIAVGATTTAYTADRWYLTTGANQASVVSATTALSNNSILAGKVLRNSGQTGTTAMTFGYPMDSDEVIRSRGRTISLSFLAKAGANFSPTSGTLTYSVAFGTGAVAKRGAGFTGETVPITGTVNLTTVTSTTNAVSSAAVATNVTQGEVQFTWTPTGTAGADDSFTIDDVQLETATNSSTYDTLPFDVMVHGCKRHYRKSFSYATAPAQAAGLVGALAVVVQAASTFGIWVAWEPTELRATAAVTTYSPQGATANWIASTLAVSINATVDTTIAGPKAILITASTAVAAGEKYFLQYQADSGI